MKLKNRQILGLLQGLRDLDGQKTTEKTPEIKYKFTSLIRLAIAKNITRCSEIAEDVEKARQKSISDCDLDILKPDDPKRPLAQRKFQQEYIALIEAECELVTTAIKESDLKLDDNPIPSTTLALLMPLLENTE